MVRLFAWRAFVVAVACGLALPAFAADGEKKPPPDPEKVFKRKDANGDGMLSLEEFKTNLPEQAAAKADARFKKLDTSGDGKLSLDEFKAGMKPKT